MFNLKSSKLSLFGDTKNLEKDIDEFVNILSEVGLSFKSIVKRYLSHSTDENFEAMLEKVTEIEVTDSLQSMVILSTFKDNKVVPV